MGLEPIYQGYIDERSTHHIAGWLRELAAPRRVAYEVLLEMPDSTLRLLHAGTADQFSNTLLEIGVGDGAHAFFVEFPTPLTPCERDRVFVRPAGAEFRLELAPELQTLPPGQRPPKFQGYVDELSIGHAAGWLRDLNNAAARFEVEIVLPGESGETVLACGLAAGFSPALRELGIGDGTYTFNLRFAQLVPTASCGRIFARPAGASVQLERAPALVTSFPVIDRVDLPASEQIAPETFASVLALAPYIAPGGLRLTGLTHASLNLIGRVPAPARRVVSLLADLARRTPPILFEWAAKSEIHHITVHAESFQPETFSALRPDAGLIFFVEQFTALAGAIARARPYYANAPHLHYNIALHPMNLAELPGLVRRLAAAGNVWKIDITPAAEIAAPQLAWLEGQLAAYPQARVVPRGAEPAAVALTLQADGLISAQGQPIGNINEMEHPIDAIVWGQSRRTGQSGHEISK